MEKINSRSGNSAPQKFLATSQMYAKLTQGLSPKIRNIFERRFGVKSGNPETLESIGQRLGITRERVRQIEEAGFAYVKKNHKEALDAIFGELETYFNGKGGFKREEAALAELGGQKNKPYVLFMLAIGGDKFSRVCGKRDYHYFWSTEMNGKAVKENLASLVADIKSHGKLLSKDQVILGFGKKYNLTSDSLASFVEISKRIQENKEGQLGLVDWPEIKPRGVKDRAFLVFKREQKPLHFRKITELIDTLEYDSFGKKAHAQTVHNELIKDQRFVLVGRGTYALKEWGYYPGTIRDVITKILKEKNEAGAAQDDIVKEVLTQRLVAKNTVLINLNNKKYFQKNDTGKYFINEVQTV